MQKELKSYGRILEGQAETIKRSHEEMSRQDVDQVWPGNGGASYSDRQTTLAGSQSVSGPGTFFGKAQRTLVFCPSDRPGWWIERSDQPDELPIYSSVENVWTTVRNIVLRSGSPHNYLRMVEHIVALRVGMGLDNCLIKVESGDPPLFDRSSMDLVEAVDRARIVPTGRPAEYYTVSETVTMEGPGGSFLTFHPAAGGSRALTVDCAVKFPNAHGRQRIQFEVTPESFRHGAFARTNTTLQMMLYVKTLGKIFADTRHLGYTPRNILVAGPRKYFNEPRHVTNGKALEAVWHRATLDLLAAVALIGKGRLAGHIVSYKAGHALDCRMITRLYKLDLLRPLQG